jgi:hypothetical protein
MRGTGLRFWVFWIFWMAISLASFAAQGALAFVPKPGPNLPQAGIPAELPAAVRDPIERLYAKDPFVRAEAAIALGEMGADAVGAIPYLVSMLDDDRGLTDWKRAQLLLSRIEEKFPVALVPGVFAKGLFVGDQAAIALARIGPPAVEALIGALRNTRKDGFVIQKHWSNAAWALGRIGDPRAVEALIDHLGVFWTPGTDPGTVPGMRGAYPSDAEADAAAALGKIKDERAILPLLFFMAKYRDEAAKIPALGALQEITGERIGPDVAKWFAWSKSHAAAK